MNHARVIHICIDGGPCGGKTTGLSSLVKRLQDNGAAIAIIPETATFIASNAYESIADLEKNEELFFQFQEDILDAQLYHHALFERRLRAHQGTHFVCISDRGTLTNEAYVGESFFRRILHKRNLSHNALLHMYDAICIMTSIAHHNPQLYVELTRNHPTRHESPEEACALDGRIQKTWNGHPRVILIGDRPTPEEKTRSLINAVEEIIGNPQSIAIERKFRVNTLNPIAHMQRHSPDVPIEVISIEQIYLFSNAGEERIRQRVYRGVPTYWHTRKHLIADSRLIRREDEERISEEEYMRLRELRHPGMHVIKKRRACFMFKDQYFELDEFMEPAYLQSVALLEVQLTQEHNNVTLPPWFTYAGDVTEDPRYSNRELAHHLPQ